jgi:hypothetical protein
MPSTYRLLRNNKETGPYSLEELLQLSLKPFDLIWVEGHSAGWRYPSEVETLKSYMESDSLETATTPVQYAVSRTEIPIENTSHVLVSDMRSMPEERGRANDREVQNFSFGQAPAVNEEEEEITAEKLEQKANEIYLRVQAYTQQKEQGQQGVQTKHARSLEDLKQEYAEWLHQSKQKKSFNLSKKHIAIGGAIVVVSAAAYFLIGRSNTAEEIPVHHYYYLSNAVEKPGDYKKSKSTTTELRSTSSATAKADLTVRKELSVDQFLDSVKRELAKQDERLRVAATKSPYKKPVHSMPLVTTPSAEQKGQIEFSTKSEQTSKRSLTDQVALDAKYLLEPRRQNISSLEITIRNNSEELLKTVAVDVFYYKKGQRLFDKETVYINNVQPGNSFTLSTPGNKKAVSAKFQLAKIN